MTAQRQQREAALARLRYKQECCARMAMVEQQQQQVAASWEKVLADEATKQRCRKAVAQEKALANKADKQPHHERAAQEKVLPNDAKAQAAELALAAAQAGRSSEIKWFHIWNRNT
jgi:hypothetical protein